MTMRMRTLLVGVAACAAVLLVARPGAAMPAECVSFIDAGLPEGTPVKAIHVVELRACVDALRAEISLAPYSWGEPVSAGVTVIKAVHITELRTALGAVYTGVSQTAPTYTDATVEPGTTVIKRAHITELRAAATN